MVNKQKFMAGVACSTRQFKGINKPIYLSLSGHESLLLLLELHGHDGETLMGDVQLRLQLLGLLHQVSNLFLGLLSSHLGRQDLVNFF